MLYKVYWTSIRFKREWSEVFTLEQLKELPYIGNFPWARVIRIEQVEEEEEA